MSFSSQSGTAALWHAPAPTGDTTRTEGERKPGRVAAQRGLFAGPLDRVPPELYASVEQGHADRRRHEVTVEPFSRVSMNTYFGRFPASYWQRWTTADDVRLEATVSGSGMLSVLASDVRGDSRIVLTIRVTDAHERRVTMTPAIDRFVDGGALWLELATDRDTLHAHDISWEVLAPPEPRRTAVVICTHNRPDDCLQTLAALAGDGTCMQLLDAVHVIDQGDETVDSRDAFQNVTQQLGSRLRYRRQANLGGAGGFTRGLYDVTDGTWSEPVNVLFMDDDILLEPDTVIRMTTFANKAVEPVIVGAQMLYLLHPELAYSWAQATDLPALRAAVPVPRKVLRVDVTRQHQEVRVDAGYNAWWSCLIPAEVVASTGYPLPMFFQWDDVEYGHRARAHGHPTVTLAGAGVWHDDYDWKDADNPSNYFNHRNSLITAALHTDFDPKRAAQVIRQRLLRHLVSMRYGLTATVLQGVEDFLRGPECLYDGGVEAMASVQKLRAEYPETQIQQVSELPAPPSTARPLVAAPPPPSRERLVMAKRLLWQLLRKPRGCASMTHRQSPWWHVSRYATVVVTDASQQGVRVRRLDRAELVALGKRTFRVLRRLRRDGRAVARSYRDAMPELTGRHNWQRLFDGQ